MAKKSKGKGKKPAAPVNKKPGGPQQTKAVKASTTKAVKQAVVGKGAKVVKAGAGARQPSTLDELSKAAKVTRNKGEQDKAYVERVVGEVAKLADTDYDALSEGAQAFYNAAAAAINGDGAWPAIPGMGPAEPEKAADEPAPATAESAPAPDTKAGKTGGKKKASTAAATPAPAPADTKKTTKAKGKKKAKGNGAATTRGPASESLATLVRQAVISKPDATLEQVSKKLGVEVDANVSLLYAEANAVVSMHKDAKARKAALDEGSSGDKIRAVIAAKPGLDFEDAVAAAGLPKKAAKPGSYVHNRWRGSRTVMEMLTAK